MKKELKGWEVRKAASGVRYQSSSLQTLTFAGDTHLADSLAL